MEIFRFESASLGGGLDFWTLTIRAVAWWASLAGRAVRSTAGTTWSAATRRAKAARTTALPRAALTAGTAVTGRAEATGALTFRTLTAWGTKAAWTATTWTSWTSGASGRAEATGSAGTGHLLELFALLFGENLGQSIVDFSLKFVEIVELLFRQVKRVSHERWQDLTHRWVAETRSSLGSSVWKAITASAAPVGRLCGSREGEARGAGQQ